jgi:hypothetical protein
VQRYNFFYNYRHVIKIHGTGSKPDPPQGVHLKIRLKASQPPFSGPYFFIASTAYCEQVGV